MDFLLPWARRCYRFLELESILERLTHRSKDALRQYDLPLAYWETLTCAIGIIIIMTVILSCIYRASRSRRDTVGTARNVLRSLFTVITPTQSLWPSGYASLAFLAAAGSSTDNVCVQIPLDMLYHDLVCGKIELRRPPCHLPLLLRGSFTTLTGVGISLEASVYWWSKVLGWVIHCSLLQDDLMCHSIVSATHFA